MLKHSEESYDVYKEISKSNDLEVKVPLNKKNKKIQMHQKKIMDILNKNSKEEFFIQKSLFIFSLSNPLRKFCKFLLFFTHVFGSYVNCTRLLILWKYWNICIFISMIIKLVYITTPIFEKWHFYYSNVLSSVSIFEN